MNLEQFKILVVDDEPAVAKVTAQVLATELPCEIILTTSPNEATQILRKEEIAVLLCDLCMPELDGTTITRLAKSFNPYIVSIFITGRITKEAIIDGMNDGTLWRCIEKPWTPNRLIPTVREALELYHSRTQAALSGAAVASDPDQANEEAGTEEEEEADGQTPSTEGGKRKIVLHRSAMGRRSPTIKSTVGLRLQGKEIVIRKPSIQGSPSSSIRHHTTSIRRVGLGKGVFFRKKQRHPGGASDESAPKPIDKANIPEMINGRFQIVNLIKEGGSGSIYKANDTLLNMIVAIKILSESFAHNRESMSLLLHEARVAMQLSHKHIVRLFNIEETNGLYYLVMEYIEGCTLRDVLAAEGTLSIDTVAQIADILGDALGYAHRRNIYHRDLKPDNIMASNDGVLKIIDFGLACLSETTRKGDEIEGTPYYMSPEEIRGEQVDQRTDIYALGVMFHELLTGKLPVPEGKTVDFLNFVPVVSHELPLAIRRALEKSLAVDRNQRWQDVTVFTKALRDAALSTTHELSI